MPTREARRTKDDGWLPRVGRPPPKREGPPRARLAPERASAGSPVIAPAGDSQRDAGEVRVPWSDLRGVSLLVHDAVVGITDLVESMHGTIQRVPPITGVHRGGRTRGITGLVYRSVRGVTRLVGAGVDGLLRAASHGSAPQERPDRSLAFVAALNGVLGDRLEASGNPLALAMTLLHRGAALDPTPAGVAAAFRVPPPSVVVLVHGLCMSDRQWTRQGHDHGVALQHDLGCEPLNVRYNTGRSIAANGRDLAALLDRLWRAWPGAAPRLAIVAHSLGGLVARSACAEADAAGQAWRPHLRALVFLGTPHHGAPLERAGRRLETVLALSPYLAPFGRLGAVRSAGIHDLAHGAAPVPLPAGVRCHAIAATTQRGPSSHGLRGDGLVPVASALGRQRDAGQPLAFRARDTRISYGTGHLDLLGPRVYPAIRAWMEQAYARPRPARSVAAASSTVSVDEPRSTGPGCAAGAA